MKPLLYFTEHSPRGHKRLCKIDEIQKFYSVEKFTVSVTFIMFMVKTKDIIVMNEESANEQGAKIIEANYQPH